MPSIIQPGVLAFGKNHKTTFLPEKSVKDTKLPLASGKVKLGALSPDLSNILSHFHILVYCLILKVYFSVSVQLPSQSLTGELVLNSSHREIYNLQGVVGRPIYFSSNLSHLLNAFIASSHF